MSPSFLLNDGAEFAIFEPKELNIRIIGVEQDLRDELNERRKSYAFFAKSFDEED